MDLQDIQFIFNRAWSLTMDRKKLTLVFTVLMLCGLLVLFFRSLAIHTNMWIGMSLTFLPIFFCAGVLLSLGVILIRVYHDEIKKRHPISFRKVIGKSWDLIIGTSYLSIPIILGYLLLWMILGIFFLLNDLPALGGFFSIILAFGPFLLNLGAIFLCVVSVSMLFFLTPLVSLRGLNRIQLSKMLARRFQEDMFLNLLLATIAATPLLILSMLLMLAASMTGVVCYACENQSYHLLQWFFMMIPFTAVLAPAVVFFFNFAAEAHVLIQRQRA